MADNTELKRLAFELIAANDLFNESPQDNEVGDAWSLANDRFTEAASPEVIQALIADLDEARNGMKYSCAIRLKKQIEQLETERDQLRAEVAGLRTGYEAYEQVKAELKAENEALRAKWENPDPILIQCMDSAIAEQEQLEKDARRYQWLRDKSESIHQFYLSTPIWFSGVKFSKENVDSTIDAALGQGEQS